MLIEMFILIRESLHMPYSILIEQMNGSMIYFKHFQVKAAKAQARQPKNKSASTSNDQQKTTPNCEVSEQTAPKDTPCSPGASGDSPS